MTEIYAAGTTKFFGTPSGIDPDLLLRKKWKIVSVHGWAGHEWYWIKDIHNKNRQLQISARGWEERE